LERLVAIVSAKEFIQELASMEITVKKSVTVADLMSTPPKFLGPDATVKDALDFMSLNHIGYIPICSESGKLLGDLTIADILTAGIPEYARTLTNLKFLSALEPFEDLLETESTTPLSTIMIRPPLTLSPQAMVYEAVFEFLKHNRRHYSVIQDGICVGVLSTVDLINKCLRA
jgi:CBS domain-containing protein